VHVVSLHNFDVISRSQRVMMLMPDGHGYASVRASWHATWWLAFLSLA
jgi:hypothetical protein